MSYEMGQSGGFTRLREGSHIEAGRDADGTHHVAGWLTFVVELYMRVFRSYKRRTKADSVETMLVDHPRLRSFYRAIASRRRGDRLGQSVMLWTPQGARWQFSKSDLYSSCLGEIHDDLAKPGTEGLHIAAVSASNAHIKQAFSFMHKLWFTLRGRESDAMDCIRSIFEVLIINSWAVPPSDPGACKRFFVLLRQNGITWKEKKIYLPSSGSRPATDNFIDDMGVGLTDKTSIVSFYWLRDPPQYRGDVRIYVEQPLGQRPEMEWVRIMFLDSQGKNRKLAFLGTSSTSLLQRMSVTREGTSKAYNNAINTTLRSQSLWLYCVVLRCMTTDVTHFLGTGARYADEMDAYRDLQRSIEDLQYLVAECDKLGEQAVAIAHVTEKQMELSQSFWSTVLAFVVAIYVPLSFASSIFGMNIQDNNEMQYSITTTRHDPSLPSPGPEVREDILTTEPGTKAWPLKIFIITAFALGFGGVGLPLLAGPLFRIMLGLVYRYKVWGRVMVVPLPIGILVMLNTIIPYVWALGLVLVATFLGWQIGANFLKRRWLAVLLWFIVFIITCGLSWRINYDTDYWNVVGQPIVLIGLTVLLWILRPDSFIGVGQIRYLTVSQPEAQDTTNGLGIQ